MTKTNPKDTITTPDVGPGLYGPDGYLAKFTAMCGAVKKAADTIRRQRADSIMCEALERIADNACMDPWGEAREALRKARKALA